MRHVYSHRNDRGTRLACVDLVPPLDGLDGDAWLITRVSVPKEMRGKGVGRELMKQVTEDADKDHAILELVVEPDGSGGLDEEELTDWYGRLGFRSCGTIMRRYPNEAP